jgi:hypothetical protein
LLGGYQYFVNPARRSGTVLVRANQPEVTPKTTRDGIHLRYHD